MSIYEEREEDFECKPFGAKPLGIRAGIRLQWSNGEDKRASEGRGQSRGGGGDGEDRIGRR